MHSASPTLATHQVVMISIGGVIGAGLFVGSAKAIAQAGPLALVAYTTAALLMLCVMWVLAELATARPDLGSFSVYADSTLGRWAGFSVGWLYWWYYLLLMAIESLAAGHIVHGWVPTVPEWLAAAAVIIVMMGCNCLSVRAFGQAEYGLSFIKVIAIVAFLAVGTLTVTGVVPHYSSIGLSLLTDHGGFAPNGWAAGVSAFLIALFSFQGCEIATIAAAESDHPIRNVRASMRAVVWRITLFYLGSILLVLCLVPWNSPLLNQGAYQAALQVIGIPGASVLMDAVIFTAVISCLNSALYTASRMAWSLSKRGDAPAQWKVLSVRHTPWKAIVSTAVVALAIIMAHLVFPSRYMEFLLNSGGAAILLVYCSILASQLVARRKWPSTTHDQICVPCYPWFSAVVLVMMASVFAIMAFMPEQRSVLGTTLALTAVLVAIGLLRHRGAANSPT